MKIKIKQCDKCERYDLQNDKMRNGIYCMFSCESLKRELAERAYEYNRSVSGEEFDTQELFEHGKKVYGSGWKGE